MSNATVSLDKASRAVDDLLERLRQVEQERDEGKQFLRSIIAAHDADDMEALENAIHYADFWLKGGL